MPDREVLKDVHFPKAGIDLTQAFENQPNKPLPSGEYARTTPVGLNVRGFEARTNRDRGGSRCGLSKWINAQVAGQQWIVQDLDLLIVDNPKTPQGNMPQPSQSGRIVTVVAVSLGNVYSAGPGDTAWTLATNLTAKTTPLNASGVVFSAPNNQKLYFVDGVNYVFFKPSDNTVKPWVPGTTDSQGNVIAGVLPVDSANNTARLICVWRGRTVLSGLLLDPQNWFMSAISDPNNWDYSPTSTTPSQAIAGNNSPLGTIGDVVTSLIPYTDDVLVFGGDHTIWLMNGDPMSGGQIDLVSDSIGMAWGIPWCKDPLGNIYFVSNRTGIYTLIPGNAPQRISQQIEQLLFNVDTGTNSIRLMWDDRFQGLHVFISPILAPTTTTHLFYEARTGAWWQDQFASTNFDPIAMVVADGNTPGDRIPLIGSWDGYVRKIDYAATTDDGLPIPTQVLIGPLLTPNMDEMLIKSVQAILGETSGNVNYALFIGRTAEAALASAPIESGVWTASRNPTFPCRHAAHAIYIVLTSSNPWAMEAIRISISTEGKVRRRKP